MEAAENSNEMTSYEEAIEKESLFLSETECEKASGAWKKSRHFLNRN